MPEEAPVIKAIGLSALLLIYVAIGGYGNVSTILSGCFSYNIPLAQDIRKGLYSPQAPWNSKQIAGSLPTTHASCPGSIE
jgi:hypothetical protein